MLLLVKGDHLFFSAAYEAYWRKAPDRILIEDHVRRYFEQGNVPIYVRRFIREPYLEYFNEKLVKIDTLLEEVSQYVAAKRSELMFFI